MTTGNGNVPATALIYEALNLPVLASVPSTARRILDLGCGSGTLGAQLKKNQPCEAIGITYSQAEAEQASAKLDTVLVRDLNVFDPAGMEPFDCIIASHVLEHLYQPGDLLARLHPVLAPEGVLIVALPNTLQWQARLEFARGRFRYTDGGVMDRTHFRFFDWETAHALVKGAGFLVVERTTEGNFPLPGLRRVSGPLATFVDRLAVSAWPGLFGRQFIVIAKP